MEGSCRGLNDPRICLQKPRKIARNEKCTRSTVWDLNPGPVEHETELLWRSSVLVSKRNNSFTLFCSPLLENRRWNVSLDFSQRHYFFWKLAFLHTNRFTRRKAGQRSPPFQFVLSRGPRVVQCIAVKLSKTKRDLLYIRNRFVPRSKQFPPQL